MLKGGVFRSVVIYWKSVAYDSIQEGELDFNTFLDIFRKIILKIEK